MISFKSFITESPHVIIKGIDIDIELEKQLSLKTKSILKYVSDCLDGVPFHTDSEYQIEPTSVSDVCSAMLDDSGDFYNFIKMRGGSGFLSIYDNGFLQNKINSYDHATQDVDLLINMMISSDEVEQMLTDHDDQIVDYIRQWVSGDIMHWKDDIKTRQITDDIKPEFCHWLKNDFQVKMTIKNNFSESAWERVLTIIEEHA
jgi:hypothetical protein